MKPVIHEAFGDIFYLDTCRFLELSQINNALVSHPARFPLVQNRIIPLKAPGNIVRARDSHLRGLGKPWGAHESYVSPRNTEDASAPKGCGGYRPDRIRIPVVSERMGRQVRS